MSRLVLGINAVRAALTERPREVQKLYLRAGSQDGEIAKLARSAGVRWQVASPEQLGRIAQGGRHQGVAAELADFRYLPLGELLDKLPADEMPLLMVLDGIEDPQNLGAILRSAVSLGVHGVVLPRDRAVGVTPAVARAAAGAVEVSRIAQVVNLSRALEEIQERGLWTAAADQSAAQPVWAADLNLPLALVIGAEGKGVRPLVRRHCQVALRIPILGPVGSLNASVAAGVMLYETLRQRRLAAEKNRESAGPGP